MEDELLEDLDEENLSDRQRKLREPAPFGREPVTGYAYARPVEQRKLTPKQLLFIDFYMQHFNAQKAARQAAYSPHISKNPTLLTKNAAVQAEIARRREQMLMSTQEMQLRLAQQARAEYADYYNADGTVDLEQLLADGKGHLIKTIRRNKDGYLEVIWHDAQNALTTLAKIDGLFTERSETTGEVTLRVVYGPRPIAIDSDS